MNIDAIKAAYARALGEFETVIVRRYTGTGPNRPRFDVPCRARVTGYTPDEMIGGIAQADRKCILLYDDLIAAGFGLPVTNSDKAVVQGKEHAIRVPDNCTRRAGNVVIAYELQLVG